MKVLLFDNYDSFTYNLLHILKELGAEVEVHRNDKISLDEVERFDKILLSPGPGIPEEAGILLPLPFVGRIEREFPRLPGDHGRGCGRRTDHGASPSRI